MKLYDHQTQAVNKVLKNEGCGALFMGLGTGKTLTGIETFRRLKEKDPNLRMLVVCPLSLISTWEEEIGKFTSFKSHNLRSKKFDKTADIYIINYELVRRANYYRGIVELSKEFPLLCFLDESSKIKNHRASVTKSLLKLSLHFKYRIIASGTPAPNGEWEYWSQIEFVKPGLL